MESVCRIDGARLTVSQPVSSLDIVATNAALADAPLAADRPLDGGNLIPHVRDETSTPPHEAIFVRTFDQQRSTIHGGDEKWMTGQTPSLSQRFRGCQSPHPAAADVFHSLLGLTMKEGAGKKKPTKQSTAR